MTVSINPKEQSKRARKSIGNALFGAFALFCLLLILKNAETAVEYMHRGLLLCSRTVIPSLFPFMILSELIVSGGLGGRLLKILTFPLRRLLGVSTAGGRAILLGILCGFPIGARCAVRSLERGEISPAEAERVISLSCVPSSAFLISAVGVSLWGNRRFGLALYATVLASTLITGILFRLPNRRIPSQVSAPPAPPPTLSGSNLFTEAVRSSTWSILTVCAYVVFFSTLVGTLSLSLGRLNLSADITALLFCLFELSSGVSNASALGNVTSAAVLCAFAAGWSGLSVHCQLLSVCDGYGISARPYFLAKLLQALLCALLFSLVIRFFPEITVPAEICSAYH